MGIKFRCPECDKKLHVKAFLAGKRGICPHCGGKVRIPMASTIPAPVPQEAAGTPARAERHVGTASSAVQPSEPSSEPRPPEKGASGPSAQSGASHDPIAEAPDAVWYVRPPSGGQYGPAAGDLMRQWVDEGRVAPGALVWREGWNDWQQAADVFPRPAPEPSAPVVDDADLPTIGEKSRAAGTVDFPAATPRSRHRKLRSSPARRGRNVALIASLAILCVALLVALIYVLATQG